jgi:gamma-glutamyltranspeptidase/glutathione hydrolase
LISDRKFGDGGSRPQRLVTIARAAMLTGAGLCAAALVIALEACTASPSPGLPPITSLETVEPDSPYGVVATGFAEATEAGVLVLENGGNAIDAAVAAAFVGFSAAPGSCGLFGTTYIVIHLADGRDIAIDGTARVPLRTAWDELATLQAEDRLYGVKTAAVPGSLAALDHALARYGTKSLAEILEPAIAVAEQGFQVTSSKRAAINKYVDTIREGEYLRQLLLADGQDVPDVGTTIRQSDLARTMRRIATHGADDFYRGSIAKLIDHDMRKRGGYITRGDLGIYRVTERRPLRGTYRDTEVIGFPWPGAGGAVIEALNVLEQYPPEFLREPSANQLQAFAEAFHIAIADHARFTSSSTVTGHPPDTMYTGKAFAAERTALISFDQALSEEALGQESNFYTPPGGTTQVSVADRFGNVVSLTQTMGRFFGARAMTPGLGVVYNSFLEGYDHQHPATAAPRTACPTDMSPTIVLKDGRLVIALGSSGSRRIPGIVALVLSNVVDRNMGVRDAVLAPRVVWDSGSEPGILIEVFPPNTGELVETLEARGYQIVHRVEFPATRRDFINCGAVNAVVFDPVRQSFAGVGDPRRQGVALAARR